MFKKKLTRLERWLFLAPLLVVVVPWLLSTSSRNWPPYLRLSYPAANDRRSSCQRNLKQIQTSVSLYVADYDSRFPPVKGKPGALGVRRAGLAGGNNSFSGDAVGWANSLKLYTGSDTPYMCPAEITASVTPTKTNYTDYWFNSNLSTLPKTKVAAPASTLLIGEGNDGKDVSDAAYSRSSLPSSWLSDPNSPAFRHLGGANYLMADGSVHWLEPQQVTTFGGRKDAFAAQ